MIINFFRWLIGYKYDWVLFSKVEYENGILYLFICKKTGRFKKIWLGS